MAKINELKIDKNNIDLLVTPSYARKIREGFVKTLEKEFIKSEFYNIDSLIVLNANNGTYNIIDGNHRITAIKNVLKTKDKFFKINVITHNFDTINEIKMFNMLNTTQKITKDDIIKANQEIYPIIKEAKTRLNLSIYSNATQLKLGTLLTSYFGYCNKKQSIFFTSSTGNIFLEKIKVLTNEDICFLEEYLNFHELIFGSQRNSMFFKGSFMNCCMKLFFKNRELINNNKDKMVKIYNSCILVNREDFFRPFTKSNSTNDTKICYELLGTIIEARTPIYIGKFMTK